MIGSFKFYARQKPDQRLPLVEFNPYKTMKVSGNLKNVGQISKLFRFGPKWSNLSQSAREQPLFSFARSTFSFKPKFSDSNRNSPANPRQISERKSSSKTFGTTKTTKKPGKESKIANVSQESSWFLMKFLLSHASLK